jgi:hypothetical protein
MYEFMAGCCVGIGVQLVIVGASPRSSRPMLSLICGVALVSAGVLMVLLPMLV